MANINVFKKSEVFSKEKHKVSKTVHAESEAFAATEDFMHTSDHPFCTYFGLSSHTASYANYCSPSRVRFWSCPV